MTESNDQSAGEISVDRIAGLAKLSAAHESELEGQLRQILQFVTILDELQLDAVEPFFGASDFRPSGAAQPIRDDQPQGSLQRDEVLRNAPKQDSEFYVVPPVFD